MDETWLTTDGLTLLIEELNRPCRCETERLTQCATERLEQEDPVLKKEMLESCQKAGHRYPKKYYHRQPECIGPVWRWYKEGWIEEQT